MDEARPDDAPFDDGPFDDGPFDETSLGDAPSTDAPKDAPADASGDPTSVGAARPLRPTEVPARAERGPAGLVRRSFGALVPVRRQLRGTIYLVLDHSTSMADPGKMDQLRQGALRFFLEAVQRDHAVGAVAFSRTAQVVYRAGIDAHRFWQRLHSLRPYGRTAMADGLRLGLWRLRFRPGRKVIVLITDGMPDDREATLDAARLARARGVTLIPIGTGAADHAFLASLAGRPELARHVEARELAAALAAAASDLDRS